MPERPVKHLKKRYLIAAGAVAAFFILLLTAALLLSNELLRRGIESYATKILGTPVSVGRVSLSFLRGEVTIEDFRIANPPGCTQETALSFQRVFAKMKLSSLLQDEIVIRELEVSGLSVLFEMKDDGISNLAELKKNAERFSASSEKDSKKDPAREKRIKIEKLVVAGTELQLSALKINASLKLPDLEMENPICGEKLPDAASALISRTLTDIGTAIKNSKIKLSDLKLRIGSWEGDAEELLKQGNKILKDGITKGLLFRNRR